MYDVILITATCLLLTQHLCTLVVLCCFLGRALQLHPAAFFPQPVWAGPGRRALVGLRPADWPSAGLLGCRGSLGRSQFVLGGAGWSSLFWIAFCSRLICAPVLAAGVWRPSSAATTGGGLAVGAYWKAGRLWVRGHGRCCWGFVGGVRCVLGRRS